MEAIMSVIEKFGFPVFVAIYLLVSQRKLLEDFKSSIQELTKSNILLKDELAHQSEIIKLDLLSTKQDINDIRGKIEACQRCHIVKETLDGKQ